MSDDYVGSGTQLDTENTKGKKSWILTLNMIHYYRKNHVCLGIQGSVPRGGRFWQSG
jgi:hypothetical protein